MTTVIQNTDPVSRFSPTPLQVALYNDIQGNILKSHSKKFTSNYFLKIKPGIVEKDLKKFISKDLSPFITSFSDQIVDIMNWKLKNQNSLHVHIAISKNGYKYLKVKLPASSSKINGLEINDPNTELIGAKESKEKLINENIKDWEAFFQGENEDNIDFLLLVGFDEEIDTSNDPILKEFKSTILNKLPQLFDIHIEKGKALKDDKEHFGFADGISQPEFFKEDINFPTNEWNPSATLDLVLARDPNGNDFATDKSGNELSMLNGGSYSYGSFLVFRKLEQKVKDWNKAVKDGAKAVGIDQSLFGAFSVGRFQDGTPLAKFGTAIGNKTNDFNFSSDTTGSKCPFHSHIRKTNPRGESRFEVDDKLEFTHKIVRRGIPYADIDRDPDLKDEPENGVGLLFMCYQSNISHQFEFMQSSWANNQEFNPIDTGIDGVIGEGINNPNQQHWPTFYDSPNRKSFDFRGFVKLKGAEYFFSPSLSFLKNL